MSPTERTLKYLRERGFIAEVVERWIPGANIRKDLFGFIDIVAVPQYQCWERSPSHTLGVQCTSSTNVAARLKKIRESKNLAPLKWAEWNIWVMGWAKGKREPRIEIV